MIQLDVLATYAVITTAYALLASVCLLFHITRSPK